MAWDSGSPGWWRAYSDMLPAWFETYLGLEGAAAVIRTYVARLIPGLLQTQNYAWALTQHHHPDADSMEVQRRVEFHMARQERFAESGGPKLWPSWKRRRSGVSRGTTRSCANRSSTSFP
jgi:hypothetical protein